MTREVVKIIAAALDETDSGEIVIRGVIDPATLNHIRSDDYQREVLPLASLTKLIGALRCNGPVPPVVLGMRGEDYSAKDGAYLLHNDVYVIDGLQRISAARHLILTQENLKPRLGATVYFNTTSEGERELFKILGTSAVKVSPNILLRNMRDESVGVHLLWELSRDPTSCLSDRVCWQQRQRRDELITALILLKTSLILHSAFAPLNITNIDLAAETLSALVRDGMGKKIVYQNIRTFFEILDENWGVRLVTYKEGALHLHSTFMGSLAKVFARYSTFWDQDRRLFVSADLKRKLKLFRMNDPMVLSLIKNTSNRNESLVMLIADHLNSGRRTRRLVPFKPADDNQIEDNEEVAVV
jgi:hypothetical protein